MSIDLEPRAVFDIFSEISKIPRGSGNEAAIASHIVAWAKEKGLWSEKDAAQINPTNAQIPVTQSSLMVFPSNSAYQQ